MAFWLIICVLLAGAAALLVVPAMRHGKQSAATRDALNKAFYQDRLSELEQDEQQGVVAERPELVKELQQNLLNDINDFNEKDTIFIKARSAHGLSERYSFTGVRVYGEEYYRGPFR